MSDATLALKVNVTSFTGTREGVPALRETLDRFGIRATFYFSLGPDNSGKAIRRIFIRRGFLRTLLRVGPLAIPGLTPLLYGILSPPPMMGARLAQLLRGVADDGHEVGIHAWDHVKWHDLLPWFPKPVTAMELGKAGAAFQEIFGFRARTTAAPGWTVSPDALEVQDAMGLDYCSDCRGTSPFYPVMGGRAFSTLQVPTTWPTMDELLGRDGITRDTVNDHYLDRLGPGLNVHTIHAEIEGRAFMETFSDLLGRLGALGVRFTTLAEAARDAMGHSPPDHEVRVGEIPGRPGTVALQGSALP